MPVMCICLVPPCICYFLLLPLVSSQPDSSSVRVPLVHWHALPMPIDFYSWATVFTLSSRFVLFCLYSTIQHAATRLHFYLEPAFSMSPWHIWCVTSVFTFLPVAVPFSSCVWHLCVTWAYFRGICLGTGKLLPTTVLLLPRTPRFCATCCLPLGGHIYWNMQGSIPCCLAPHD